MQPSLFFVLLKTVLLLISKWLIMLCKTANLTVFSKQNHTLQFFFLNQKVDSQAEVNSLEFFVLIYCCVYLGGLGG